MESGRSPEAFSERFNTTDEPGVPDPEDRLSATCASPQVLVAKTMSQKRETRDRTADQYI